jgi:DNA-binding NarL/FixJ family response regulator
MKIINLLLVDDHELVIKGLTLMLETQKNIDLKITPAKNGKEALKLLEKQAFDLIMLDINMPVLDGISTLKKIKEQEIETPVLMLTMHKEEDLIRNALSKGAAGYILKNSNLEEITRAIITTLKRDRYLSNEVADILFKQKSENQPTLIQNEFNLTLREIQIISMLVKEMTSKEIGDQLFISKRTVEGHRNKIMEKIGVKSAVGLVKFAMKYGIE